MATALEEFRINYYTKSDVKVNNWFQNLFIKYVKFKYEFFVYMNN